MTLTDNVHRLIRPHLTIRPDGTYAQQDAYLDQLAEAVKPSMRVGGTGKGGDYLPINAAAVDLWKELDTLARDVELNRRGRARGHLGSIIEAWGSETSDEWTGHLEQVTGHMITQIIELLDPPPKRRPLNAPCYDCGEEWVYNNDGERLPAVTIGTHHSTGELRDLPDMDMECTACGKTWVGNEMTWPLKIITETRVPA